MDWITSNTLKFMMFMIRSKNLHCPPFDVIWFLLFWGREKERERARAEHECQSKHAVSICISTCWIRKILFLVLYEKKSIIKLTWNTSPHFDLNYTLMLTVLRIGFFPSKLKPFFPFGFNEVLLAEARLTWWEMSDWWEALLPELKAHAEPF